MRNLVSEAGNGFFIKDYDRTIELCRIYWSKFKNSKDAWQRENKLIISCYYLDALMEGYNNSELITEILIETGKIATVDLEISLRAIAFDIYKVNQEIQKANMRRMMEIKYKGIEQEREIFEVHFIKERFNNLQIYLEYMGQQYKKWIHAVSTICNIRNEQVRFGEEVEHEDGIKIGFFSIMDMSEKERLECRLSFNEKLNQIGTMENQLPDRTKEQITMLNSIPNVKAVIREQINRWMAEIDEDIDTKNNHDIIPRINSRTHEGS
jgi:hypothetical protein